MASSLIFHQNNFSTNGILLILCRHFLLKTFFYSYFNIAQVLKWNFSIHLHCKHDFLLILRNLIKLVLWIYSKCRINLNFFFFLPKIRKISCSENATHSVATSLASYSIKTHFLLVAIMNVTLISEYSNLN